MGRREGRKDEGGERRRRGRGGGREGRVTSVCCTDRVNQKEAGDPLYVKYSIMT
mgnify:CR=1 FL=1